MASYISRPEELEKIDRLFAAVRDRNTVRAIWLTGQKGVGKTTLIDMFLAGINDDDIFKHRYGVMKIDRDVIRSVCSAGLPLTNSPRFSAFFKIGERIKDRTWYLSLIVNAIEILISVLSVGDLKDKINKFVTALNPEGEDVTRMKAELREFKGYVRELRRASKKRPLVLIVENTEYIDVQSATLLEFILTNWGAFHGMIVLEQGERRIVDEGAGKKLEGLLSQRYLTRIHVKPFEREMVDEFLAGKLHQRVFDSDQVERIHKLSGGLPGKLEEYLRKWETEGQLALHGEQWGLSHNFTEQLLQSDDDKFLDQVRFHLRDGNLDDGEIAELRKLAVSFNLKCDVGELIDLGWFERRTGYRVLYHIRSTFVGNVFRAIDQQLNKEILLHTVHGMSIRESEVEVMKEAHSGTILAATRIESQDKIQILITDNFKGKALRQLQREEGLRTLESTLEIAKGIVKGLDEAQRKGIVHGFLTPDNIIVSETGDLKVTGFGLHVGDWRGTGSSSELVQIYIPPEVREGVEPDARSNVYSLGIILYELLAGISSLARQTFAARFAGQPLRVASEKVQRVLNRALDKDPHGRFSTCREFVDEFTSAVAGSNEDEELLLRREREQAQAEEQKKSSRHFYQRVAIAVTGAVVLIVAAYVLVMAIRGTSTVIENSILISGFQIRDTTSELSKGMIEFALQRHLLQFCDLKKGLYKPLLDSSAFRHLRRFDGDTTASAHFEIAGVVFPSGGNVCIDLHFKNNKSGRVDSKTFKVPGIENLLEHGIDNMTEWILRCMEIPEAEIAAQPRTKDIFTINKDALKMFFAGDRHWARLENSAAAKDIKQAIELDPAFGLAYLRLAEIEAFQSDLDLGTTLQSATRYKSSLIWTDTLKLAALIASREGRVSEQQNYLRKLSEALQWEPRCYYDLAESYFHVVDLDNAIRNYEQAIRLRKRFALAYNHLGYSYSYRGRDKDALDAFVNYVNVDSSSNSYDSYGDGLMFAGQYEAAIAAKMRGIERGENYYGALSNIYWLSGRTGEAIDAAKHMIAHASNSSDSVQGHFRLGLIAFMQGDTQEAVRECNSTVKGYAPQRWVDRVMETEWLRGLLAYQRQDAAALSTIVDSMLVAIRNQNVTWTKYRPIMKFYTDLNSRLLMLRGSRQQAIASMTEIEENRDKLRYWSSPFDYSFLLTSQSDVYLSMADTATAEKVLHKAIGFNEHYAPAHFKLAVLQRNSNHAREARVEFRKFLDLWPKADHDHAWVQEAVKRVQDS